MFVRLIFSLIAGSMPAQLRSTVSFGVGPGGDSVRIVISPEEIVRAIDGCGQHAGTVILISEENIFGSIR